MLPHQGGVQVVCLVGTLLGPNEKRLNHVSQHLFQWLTVFLVHTENETREHGNDHDDGSGAGADTVPEQKEKRNAHECAAAKTDELSLGQVKHDFGFDFREVFGYRDVGQQKYLLFHLGAKKTAGSFANGFRVLGTITYLLFFLVNRRGYADNLAVHIECGPHKHRY